VIKQLNVQRLLKSVVILTLSLSAEAPMMALDVSGLHLERGVEFHGVVIPVPATGATPPTLKLFIGKLSLVSKKFDFFEISAVPQLKMQDVRIEILSKGKKNEWSSDLRKFFKANPSMMGCRIDSLSIRKGEGGGSAVIAIHGLIDRNGLSLQLKDPVLLTPNGSRSLPGDLQVALDGVNRGLFLSEGCQGDCFPDQP